MCAMDAFASTQMNGLVETIPTDHQGCFQDQWDGLLDSEVVWLAGCAVTPRALAAVALKANVTPKPTRLGLAEAGLVLSRREPAHLPRGE